MALRHKLRKLYIEGFYELDIVKLLGSVSNGFQFIDPMELTPIGKNELDKYMDRWNARVGLNQRWRLSNEVRQDQDGILNDWEWWELIGTPFQGTAVVTTTDQGVKMEKITYFK